MTEEQREKSRTYARQWYAKNRAKIRAKQTAYYAQNSDKIKDNSRKWYASNRDRALQSRRRYAIENPDIGRKSGRKWRAANLEKSRKYKREWAAKNPEIGRRWRAYNPEKVRESVRRWGVLHPENRRIREHKRRARKAGNVGSFTTQEWADLKAKYDNKCLACGRTEVELKSLDLELAMDHVIPLKLSETLMLPFGFLNSIDNIQPLCHGSGGCNNRKHAKWIDYRIAEEVSL